MLGTTIVMTNLYSSLEIEDSKNVLARGGGLRERCFGAHAQQLNIETLPALSPKYPSFKLILHTSVLWLRRLRIKT